MNATGPSLWNKRKAGRWALTFLVCSIAWSALPGAEVPPRPFPHALSDLEADPAVTWGVLANGLRYAIRPHQEPPGRVSLRLLVEAGRLHELDHQIGVAHFLEHMVFNGTEHYPPGEMIKLFQRLGMGFGADTNAATGFDRTYYMFELPDTAEATLEESFRALRDYADRALFLPEEVERERGIVISERRDRDTAGRRSAQDGIDFMTPYAKISHRLNATVEHTEAITRQDLVDFYERWYTATHMAVVVVGDLDPARAEALIIEHFHDVRAVADPASAPPVGILLPRGEAFDVFVDAELSGFDVDLTTVAPFDDAPDTRARRADALSLRAALAMLNRRLEKRANAEAPPFLSASIYNYDFVQFAEVTGIHARFVEAEQWHGALGAIQEELNRALTYGFDAAELAIFTANLQTGLERAVAQAESRDKRALAEQIVGAIRDDAVYLSPAQELSLYAPMLAALTPEMATAALRQAWSPTDRLVRFEGPEAPDGLYVALKEAYRANAAAAVEAPPGEEAIAFAYTDFGPAGEIVERVELEGLGAEQVVFDNHVVLSLKRTDFERGQVRVGVRFGGGRLALRPEQAGLDRYTGTVYTPGGLEAHSAEELEAILAGYSVGASFGVGDDAFNLSGVTTPRDLERQLELLAAYLVAPGFRPEAARRADQIIPQIYRQLTQTLDGVFARHVPRHLAGGDPRFGFPPEAVMAGHDLEAVKAWLEAPRRREKLEVAVVGEIDPEAVIRAVARTFGALPERERVKPSYAEAREIAFPPPGRSGVFTYAAAQPKARLMSVWPTTDRADIRLTRRLAVMAGLVDERLRVRVREELGEAYSPTAFNTSSDVYTDYGYTAAMIDADPASADTIFALVREIGENLARDGFDEDEFQRVLKPRLSALEVQYRDNGYWLNSVLLGSHERPQQLDWARSLFVDYPSITREEVLALARTYLDGARLREVLVRSEVPSAAAP